MRLRLGVVSRMSRRCGDVVCEGIVALNDSEETLERKIARLGAL
jgi:hypothetical protein